MTDLNSYDQISAHEDPVKRLYITIEASMMLSLVVVTENGFAAYFGIYQLLIVANSVILLPFLILYAVTHNNHKKHTKEREWLLLLGSILDVMKKVLLATLS